MKGEGSTANVPRIQQGLIEQDHLLVLVVIDLEAFGVDPPPLLLVERVQTFFFRGCKRKKGENN